METLNILALVAHVLIAVSIIGLVMLQRGKGADAGAGFGSGASGTVFGARGSANFLSRTTAVMAALFFASSLTLAYMNSNRQVATSLLDTTLIDESSTTESADLPPVPESEEAAGAEDALPVVPE